MAIALIVLLPHGSLRGEQALKVSRVDLSGTAFRLTLADGTVLTGKKLEGASITLGLPGQASETIRIDRIEPDPSMNDVTWYHLSVRDQATGQWQPYCEPDMRGFRGALPVAGGIDANGVYEPHLPGFELSCATGALAKCVRFGYGPWKPAVNGIPMLDFYQSCLRAIRADYCGDGTSATRDGTLIDIYDIANIQKPEPGVDFRFEAAWGPGGALCVNHTRVPDVLKLDELSKTCERLKGALGESCSQKSMPALIFNKSQ